MAQRFNGSIVQQYAPIEGGLNIFVSFDYRSLGEAGFCRYAVNYFLLYERIYSTMI